MSRIAWLVVGGLIALYKAATNECIDLLQERIVTLLRISPKHQSMIEIRQLIGQSGFSNFATVIFTAMAKRAALADYISRHSMS